MAWGLAHDQHREGKREQQRALDVADEGEHEQCPHHGGPDQHVAVTAPDSVHERPRNGATTANGGDRQQKVGGHLPAGVVGVDVEEERIGQGDGEQAVTGHREAVRSGQAVEGRDHEHLGSPGVGGVLSPPGHDHRW